MVGVGDGGGGAWGPEGLLSSVLMRQSQLKDIFSSRLTSHQRHSLRDIPPGRVSPCLPNLEILSGERGAAGVGPTTGSENRSNHLFID